MSVAERTETESAINLIDVVQYQAGAIVSRTLVKKPTGTVTAFSFDHRRVHWRNRWLRT